MIDDDMQFEAVELAERGFAPLRETTKHAMLRDAPIVADGEHGRVHKRDAAPLAQAGLQLRAQRANGGRHAFYEALIADHMWERSAHMAEHIDPVGRLDITEACLVEGDKDGDDFTHRELSNTTTDPLTLGTLDLVPVWQKRLAERIDVTITFKETHDRTPCGRLLVWQHTAYRRSPPYPEFTLCLSFSIRAV